MSTNSNSYKSDTENRSVNCAYDYARESQKRPDLKNMIGITYVDWDSFCITLYIIINYPNHQNLHDAQNFLVCDQCSHVSLLSWNPKLIKYILPRELGISRSQICPGIIPWLSKCVHETTRI